MVISLVHAIVSACFIQGALFVNQDFTAVNYNYCFTSVNAWFTVLNALYMEHLILYVI